MYVYNFDSIYTLKEAYENNVISKETLLSIASEYNNAGYEYFEYLTLKLI